MADDTPHGPAPAAEDSDRLAQLVHDLAVANDCRYPDRDEDPASGAPSRYEQRDESGSEQRDESGSERRDEGAGPGTREPRGGPGR